MRQQVRAAMGSEWLAVRELVEIVLDFAVFPVVHATRQPPGEEEK